jgi:hypothetical protein
VARRVPIALRRVLAAVLAALRGVPGLLRAVPGALRRLLRAVRGALHVLAHPLRVMRDGFRLRYDKPGMLVHLLVLLGFLAVGLALALPLPDVTHRCPAPGEGRDLCVLQKSWLPFFLIVFASLCLGQFVARVGLVRIPEWWDRRGLVGERRVGEEEVREDPPYSSDPFLLAATWGQKKGPTERRRPDLLAWLVQARDRVRQRLRRRRLPD